MSKQASASRYAKALLDVMIAEGDPAAAEQELAAFGRLFETHDELRRVMTNPAVPVQAKRAAMDQIVARTQPSRPLGKLLLLMAERDRLDLLPELVAAYRERLMDHQHVARAEVVTARPLAPDQARALEEKLARATGRRIVMTTRVDPAILGGLVARVGSTVYDGSIATHLARMKERLTQSV